MSSYSYVTRTSIITLIIVGLCMPIVASGLELSIGISNGHDYNHGHVPLKKRTAAELKKLKKQLANQLLKSKPNVFDEVWNKNSIISGFEKRELQLNDLIAKCSRSVTSFGDGGLEQLLIPVADRREIDRRQTMVKSLVQDEAMFNKLRSALSQIAAGEEAFLAYWDPNNAVHREANRFYYSLISYLSKDAEEGLNHSKVALEAGYWSSLWSSATMMLSYVFLDGLSELVTDKKKRVDLSGKFLRGDISGFVQGVMAGKAWEKFKRPFVCNNVLNMDDEDKFPVFAKIEGTDETTFDPFAFATLLYSGSAGDRYNAFYEPITRSTKAVGGDHAESLIGKPIGSLLGVTAAGAGMGANLAIWFAILQYSYQQLAANITGIRDLHKSLVAVAHFTRALQDLESLVTHSPKLVEVKAINHLTQTMNKNNWSDKYKELMALLSSSTFNSADSKVFCVSKVLLAHKLMQEVKDELVPALQAVAEFDAYCSLAQLYKEHVTKENSFTFAEFVENDTPQIQIDACWEPLVSDRQAVVNDIRLGIDGKGIRMMITGPNGCGKSTFLKSLGHAVIMAQSWGIVPAKQAQLTLFTGMRTSLDPKEDILNGISTFMAQRMRIGQVQEFVQESLMTEKTLIMLDEPYRGTTDYLTEECIYDFGKDVAQLPNVVVCIATHVKKPVELARKGSFANYHVQIESLGNGEFKRLFTIAPGAAHQWLNDRQWMKDFVYWLDKDMQRNAIKKTAH